MTTVRFTSAKLEVWFFFALLSVLSFVVLTRPHGDTFTALDHSGYRLMAHALVEGRGFHEVDRVLPEVPGELRNAMMLLPHMNERNTRDRSFLIANLDDPTTKPFFYPLLPWLAHLLERLLPGVGLDLTVPLLGVFFFAAVLWVAKGAGGFWAGGAALVFLVGSPLPFWLFRGFYVEAAGAACLAGSLALWYSGSGTARIFRLGFMGGLLGLSIAFHPVYVVISLPLVLLISLDTRYCWCKRIGLLAGFVAGFSVLVLMTHSLCQPYGNLSLSSMMHGFRVSASHRLPILIGGGSIVAYVVVLLTKRWWIRPATYAYQRLVFRVGVLFLASAPLGFALFLWSDGPLVSAGLREALLGLRWPLGVFCLLALGASVYRPPSSRSFIVLMVFLLTLPVFLYLKGAEQMGLWSQRRLLPAYTLMVLALLPGICAMLRGLDLRMDGRRRIRIVMRLAVLALLGMAGFSNLIRWPAPYWARVDAGALDWVREIKRDWNDQLVMFDYQPASFPFAVDNRFRVASLGPGGFAKLDALASWLHEKAGGEKVYWATAYANPGLEMGVRLAQRAVYSNVFTRVVSKGALPAKARRVPMRLAMLEVVPLTAQDDSLVMDKVMDYGPLGLRPPWGTYRPGIRDEANRPVSAEWCRQQSGIVGPVPGPEGWVKFSLWGRSGQETGQTVRIETPWGATTDLFVQADYGVHEALIQGGEVPSMGATGIYRIDTPTPYDPGLAGIEGYAKDLVALVHRIRIEVVKPEATMHSEDNQGGDRAVPIR